VTHHAPREQVKAALVWLLGEPEGKKPFVLVKHSDNTRQYVQFIASRTRGLILDRPTAELNEAQRRSARWMFGDEIAQGGECVGFSFQRAFGDDAATAAHCALEVFEIVYGLKDPPLRVGRHDQEGLGLFDGLASEFRNPPWPRI
jgi:hypothetical protein